MTPTALRRLAVPALAGALLLGAAAPASPPDHPVKFISVDELKAMLDRGTKVQVIDVRGQAEYEETHIRGAQSIPLRTIEPRARREISKSIPVVFY
jgi:3-mercaptopyruvate sulfurtransferase SseA